MNINPTIYRTDSRPQTHIQQTHRNHNNKSTQDTTDTDSTHTNNMGETKENDHRKIQSHNKTHTRVRFHHVVTTSIRHQHQQTTDNTKHRTQNNNWVFNRHKHTTSTGRNTHSTHKATHTTTRITDITKITTPHTPTTLHHNTTNVRNKQHTTTYNNTDYTTNIDTNPNTINYANIKTNIKDMHTTIVSTYLNNRQHNKATNTIPLTVHHSETTFPRATRRTLTQLRTIKCPLLCSYLNKIDEVKHPSPLCPLCKSEPHTLVQLRQHKHTTTGHGFVDLA